MIETDTYKQVLFIALNSCTCWVLNKNWTFAARTAEFSIQIDNPTSEPMRSREYPGKAQNRGIYTTKWGTKKITVVRVKVREKVWEDDEKATRARESIIIEIKQWKWGWEWAREKAWEDNERVTRARESIDNINREKPKSWAIMFVTRKSALLLTTTN